MDNKNFIKITKIYDDILEEEKNETDADNRKRIYRTKFNTLLKIFCCNAICYKDGKSYVVSYKDAYIIKHIIKYASIETSFIGKWFNGHLQKFTSKDIVEFYEDLETELNILVTNGKTDIVHVKDWLNTINTIIDYSNAKRVMQITNLLEDFRVSSLPLNHNIEVGQITSEDSFGNKSIVLEPNELDYNNIDDPQYFYSAKHYMNALYFKLQKYSIDMEKKSFQFIKDLTQIKINFEATGTVNDYLDYDTKEIASPYALRDANIQRYLLEKPEIRKKLEQELDIENIIIYYNIIPDESKK